MARAALDAVIPEIVAVVGDDDEDRAIEDPFLPERVEERSDHFVHVGHVAVVELLHPARSSGVQGQAAVPDVFDLEVGEARGQAPESAGSAFSGCVYGEWTS
jgi:hypothetical protein